MPKLRLYQIVATLMLVEALSSLEVSMIYTALPTILKEFPDAGKVGWLLTSYLLVQAGAAAIGGRLGDIFGRRNVLLIIICLCGLGSLMSAATSSLPVMIAGRAIQGVSGAILPLCYGIARECLAREKVPFWIGCLTGAYAALTGVGYVLGGVLSDIGSWHLIFYFAGGFAAIILIPAWWILPHAREDKGARDPVDLVGGLLFVPGLAAALIGVSNSLRWGLGSALTWGFILGGCCVLAFWAWYELRRERPLIDVRLLANRKMLAGIACFALCGLGLVQVPFVLMLMLQQPVWTGVGLGVSASIAGMMKLPSNVGTAVLSPLSGAVSARYGSRAAVVLSSGVAAMAWLYLLFRHDSVFDVVLGSVFAVGGCAMLLAAVPNLVLEVAPPERTSEATGLAAAVLGAFSAVGAQICATLLTVDRAADIASGASFPSAFAFRVVMLYVVGVALAAMLIGMTIPTRSSWRKAAPGLGTPQAVGDGRPF